jgi:hypothetical protein
MRAIDCIGLIGQLVKVRGEVEGLVESVEDDWNVLDRAFVVKLRLYSLETHEHLVAHVDETVPIKISYSPPQRIIMGVAPEDIKDLKRGDQLRFIPEPEAPPTDFPLGHPVARCWSCKTPTWTRSKIEQRCDLAQANGMPCMGKFEEPEPLPAHLRDPVTGEPHWTTGLCVRCEKPAHPGACR